MARRGEQRKERVDLKAEEARRSFSECLEDVAFRGKRVVVSRFGKPLAAIVSMADFEKLDAA